MHTINSSIKQNHVNTLDYHHQTQFDLQTPCISNFIDYDLSPIEFNNNNNNNNVLQGEQHHEEMNHIRYSQHHQHQHHHQQQHHQRHQVQQQQQHQSHNHICLPSNNAYNNNNNNNNNNQHLQRDGFFNPVTTNATDVVDMTTSTIPKIESNDYVLSEFPSSTNPISSSYGKSTFHLNKLQAFQDFKEFLLDIYHNDNDTNICDTLFPSRSNETRESEDEKNIETNTSHTFQYTIPSLIKSSTSTPMNTIHHSQLTTLHNHSNDVHRTNQMLGILNSLSIPDEKSSLHNCNENFINNNQINHCITTNCSLKNNLHEYTSHQNTTNTNTVNTTNNSKKRKGKKLIDSKSLKGKLELKFLLNQDNNTIQDTSKYSKVAKIITTKCGIPKLFVIRGRVIDARIQFHNFKSKTSNDKTLINDHHGDDNMEDVDDVTDTVTTTTSTVDSVDDDDDDADDDGDDDINLMKNQKFKLRFKPFTIFGGICTPAIGYNDPMQIPNMLSKQEQLCFIQAVQYDTTTTTTNNNNSNNNNNNVTYKLLNNGYLVMDIDFNNFCDIYQLVFPFLNSKCPSTWKKDVHITVTLIDENEKELSTTEFEVVSCASPIRDARRYQQRQRIVELEYADKHLNKTPVIIDDLNERDHHHHRPHTVQPTSQSSSKLSISDISPNSSGFGSFYSPLPSITSEEDHLNELQLYLSRSETSTPLHYISSSVTTNSITNTTTTTTINTNSNFIDVDNTRCDILSPATLHSDLVDLSSWDRMRSMKRKHSTDPHYNDRHTRKLFRQPDEQMNIKMMDLKCPVKRPIKEIDDGSCVGQEYVIKTKSRRIYRILSLLNRELSRHL